MGVTVTKIIKFISEHGFLEFLKSGFRHLRVFVFSYRPVYIYGTSSLPSYSLEPRCPLEIRKGTEQDTNFILELMNYMDHSVALCRIKDEFNQGNKPFLAFSEGKIAHVSWLFHPPKVKETLVVFHLCEGQCSIGACLTSPEFRGRNIYPVVLQYIIKEVFSKNVKKVFIAVAPHNIASTRGIEKAGFVKLKKIRGFILFGKQFNHHWIYREKCVDPDT